MSFGGRHTIAGDPYGFLTLVPAWRATAAERRSALAKAEARALLRSVLRSGEPGGGRPGLALFQLLRGTLSSELCTDETVEHRLAEAIAQDELLVLRGLAWPTSLPAPPDTGVLEEPPTSNPPPPATSHLPPAPPPAERPVPLNVAAQVNALREAARLGVPFCEECRRAEARP